MGGSKTIDLTPQSPGITINVSYVLGVPVGPLDNVTITHVRTMEQIASHRPSKTYEVTFPEEGYYRFELTGQSNKWEIIYVDSSMTYLIVDFTEEPE